MRLHRYPSFLALLLLVASCRQESAVDSTIASPQASPEIAELAATLNTVAGDSSSSADPTDSPGSSKISITGELVSAMHSELVPRTEGRVQKIYVEEGETVRRGQALLELETLYLHPQLARAEADLQRARALFKEATSDFQRKQELLERSSVPHAVFDRSEGALEQARAGVAAAEASVTIARQRLEDAILVSPFDGVVAERRVDIGERLQDTTVAYVIVQLSPLRLRFQLPERYLPLVHEGQEASAIVAPYPDEVFSGKVVLTGKVIDTATRTFPVEAELPNSDHRLRPGLFARVELATVAAPSETESPDA